MGENACVFPVGRPAEALYLRRNILYRALFQHASQSAALHAVRIANGDTVFGSGGRIISSFRRRLRLLPEMQQGCDFKLIDTVDIDAKKICSGSVSVESR